MSRSPSPAPTEIIEQPARPPKRSQVVISVKVRDFAYVGFTYCHPAPTIFDPRAALYALDASLAAPSASTSAGSSASTSSATPSPYTTLPIPGRALRRLLDSGWVSLQEANARWTPEHWKALQAYDALPYKAPWRIAKVTRPSISERKEAFRARMRVCRFIETGGDDDGEDEDLWAGVQEEEAPAHKRTHDESSSDPSPSQSTDTAPPSPKRLKPAPLSRTPTLPATAPSSSPRSSPSPSRKLRRRTSRVGSVGSRPYL